MENAETEKKRNQIISWENIVNQLADIVKRSGVAWISD